MPILRDREVTGGGHKPPLRTATAGHAVAASPQALQAALERWTESTSFKRCSPYHCELDPSPRSTIALAFSPDGQRFASTQCVTSYGWGASPGLYVVNLSVSTMCYRQINAIVSALASSAGV